MHSSLLLCFLLFACSSPESNLKEITVPKGLLRSLKSFEASAIQSTETSGRYLVAIDDTTKKDDPYLFYMNADGSVDLKPVVIDGLLEMTDIESLGQEDGYVYVLSSQSRNKKGKVKSERNLFVRGKLKDYRLMEVQSIELRSEMIRVLRLSKDQTLMLMKDSFEDSVELEASYVQDGKVFIAFKDPQPHPGIGVVVELGLVSEIFSKGKLDPAVLKVSSILDFSKSGGTTEKISDLFLRKDGSLLVTATLETGGGSIWIYKDKTLKLVESYKTEKPEGITVLPDGGVIVVFDQGKKSSLYTYLTEI